MQNRQNHNEGIKVTYLHHSGFVVELADTAFVFDYFRGSLPDLSGHKQIYVFSSHRHYDHFKQKILDWKQNYEHITYIFSDDIPKKKSMEDVIFIGADAVCEVGDLKVQTLKSTDEGVAFLVHYQGTSIYHAGDLNWWHWEEEGAAYNEMMKRNYQYAISKIEQEKIDVAFVPVDARLGDYYYYGIDWFMRHTQTKYVFPMHFWGNYAVCEQLKRQDEAKDYIDRVIEITAENQTFYPEEEILGQQG